VTSQTDATALALFFLALPVFLVPAVAADEPDVAQTRIRSRRLRRQPDPLRPSGLCTGALYRDNAATLTPDPIYSLFYDSHPKAVERIGRLESYTPGNPQPLHA
jgi:STE24 endopeptidase